MQTDSFLGSIARAFAGHDKNLSEYCFIFPNRRSGTFFLKYLTEALEGRTIIAPEVLTTGDFMARIAGITVAPRIHLLMELYLVYKEMMESGNSITNEEDLLNFDKFLPWGETVLADFSEVDLYNVDAAQIFKNVVGLQKISSDFLSEEQKEVIEQYFGYKVERNEVERFWRSVGKKNNEKSVIKDKFIALWEILPELYFNLRKRLENPVSARRLPLCMPGSAYRIALEKVLENGSNALPWKRVVVVGLDWLTTTERLLFSELKKFSDDEGRDIIEFFWDITGPVLLKSGESASNALLHNRKEFPEPAWAEEYLKENRRSSMPEITQVSIPSNSMQAKYAGDWVRQYIDKGDLDKIEDAMVALVLPDENLLLPLLHALPYKDAKSDRPGLSNVNITMGWSMRFTSTASFINHLQRLLLHRHPGKNYADDNLDVLYLVSDLWFFLSHPLVQMMEGSDNINRLQMDLRRKKRRTLGWHEMESEYPELARMLRPMDISRPLTESAVWLEELLLSIDSRLAEPGFSNVVLKSRIERTQIQCYISALNQIVAASRMAGVEMNSNTMFHLLAKLTAGQKIAFEGEPLAGLQVMGVMETRALDFDRVLILSMNDKIMPARARKRSFIPDALRRGYAMPLTWHDENRYAYWFYRLLSRANEVSLTYDSRVGEGMRSGGRSRFLLQLDKLNARNNVRKLNYNFRIGNEPEIMLAIRKSEAIMKKLSMFLKPDGWNLSSTSLSSYIKCPVQFYYRFVERIGDEPQPSQYIDALSQGNIMHDIMLHLYFDNSQFRKYLKPGKTLTADELQRIHDDDEKLYREMRRAVNRERLKIRDENHPDLDAPLSTSSELIGQRLIRQVKAILRLDIENAPVLLKGGELKNLSRWHVDDDLEINMTASFDRVDISPDGNFRVVDYKTGSIGLDLKNGLDSVFEGELKSHSVFQLLLYAHLLEERAAKEGESAANVEMVIRNTNNIENGESESRIFEGTNRYVLHHKHPAVTDFKERLNNMIREIFDPERDFIPTDDITTCDYCIMKHLCRR